MVGWWWRWGGEGVGSSRCLGSPILGWRSSANLVGVAFEHAFFRKPPAWNPSYWKLQDLQPAPGKPTPGPGPAAWTSGLGRGNILDASPNIPATPPK